MLNQLGLPLDQLHTFHLDEYLGADGHWVPIDHPLSYHAYMQENFFSRLDPRLGMNAAHIHFPDPANPAARQKLGLPFPSSAPPSELVRPALRRWNWLRFVKSGAIRRTRR